MFERQHVGDSEIVELAVRAGPHRDDFLLHRVRRELRLLQQLGQTRTTVELCLRGRIQVGGEHGEGFQRAVAGKRDLQRAGDLLQCLRLGRATDSRHRDADVDGRTLTCVEQIGLQEDLAVGNGDDVGWNISGNVTSLRFNNGQSCQRAAALCIA